MQEKDRRGPRSPLSRGVVGAGVLAVVLGALGSGVAQQIPGEAASPHPARASDEPAVGRAEDYEVLRKLLGVPAPPPKPSEPAIEKIEKQEAPPPPAPRVSPKPQKARSTPPRPTRAPVVKKTPPPAKKPAPAIPPPPATSVSHEADPSPVRTQAPAATEAAAQEPPPAEAGNDSAEVEAEAETVVDAGADPVQLAAVALPPPGTTLRADDFERWSHLLGPSAQWSLLRGATIRVSETKPIAMEKARLEATQRYHAQVELTEDRKDMRNFVAGIPFPFVKDDDPDAGVKIVLNQQSRLIVDDVDSRKMGCHLARISNRGLELERTFQVGHWRRLFYQGRLYHDPKPTWANQEGIRYREMQYPLIEPFDLKGGGWNYIRYEDVGRPDDGWLYYPVMRRVRRISTAQRSQGFFGQDMDLDSATGYAGNPAWMDWRLVGHKTMLASMHSEHIPVRWQAPPADFAADEPWEPRDVYVIEGRSLLQEYAFARRVLYVDSESWLIAYSEMYDNQGKLWKALHQSWGFGRKVREDAGGQAFEEFYLPGYAMIDMQIDHITRCELPLRSAVGDKGWFYNYGDAEGTSETAFDMVSLVGQNH